MSRHSCVVTLLALIAFSSSLLAQESDKAAIERGSLAVRGKPAMNPGIWSAKTYDSLWKQWGLAEKPADYPKAVRER